MVIPLISGHDTISNIKLESYSDSAANTGTMTELVIGIYCGDRYDNMEMAFIFVRHSLYASEEFFSHWACLEYWDFAKCDIYEIFGAILNPDHVGWGINLIYSLLD